MLYITFLGIRKMVLGIPSVAISLNKICKQDKLFAEFIWIYILGALLQAGASETILIVLGSLLSALARFWRLPDSMFIEFPRFFWPLYVHFK